MDNIELEQKILEIIEQDNYFDMILMAQAFEPEYKKSEFYKKTKKPLKDVIKESKLYYTLQLKDLGKYIQSLIDNLSLEKITQIIDQASDLFGTENAELAESLEVIKNLKN